MPFYYSLPYRAQMKNISFKTDVLPMKDKLFRLAFRITLNQQDAEDVVQETLIKIWNRHDQWDEIESLEAWALTIARNMALDVLRKQDNHRTVSLDEPLSTNTHHLTPILVLLCHCFRHKQTLKFVEWHTVGAFHKNEGDDAGVHKAEQHHAGPVAAHREHQ